MAATGGRVLGKEGAEGFYGLAVRGPVALGIVVKIADGGERCRDGVVLDVLRRARLARRAPSSRSWPTSTARSILNARGAAGGRGRRRRWTWKRSLRLRW